MSGSLVLEGVLAVCVGYFGGEWLDRKLGTTPVLKYVLLAAGLGAAIKAFIRVTRDYQNLDREISPKPTQPSNQDDPRPPS